MQLDADARHLLPHAPADAASGGRFPHSFLECSRREQHDPLFPLIGQRLPGELEAANTTGWSIKDSVNEAQPAQSASLRRG